MKKILSLLACCLFTGAFVFAQTGLKIAFINSGALLSAMPEKAKADSDIAKYTRSFQNEIEMMTKDYQVKLKDYQANEKKMDDAMQEVKGKEITDLQARIETIQQSAEQKVQQKRSDLFQPIIDKATKAINEVAKEKNYDFIFDQASGGALVFGKPMYDITDIVKAKLGIK